MKKVRWYIAAIRGREGGRMKLITMFDRPYPKEKQMEGLAISQMITSGACFKCRYYKRCSTDVGFSFPSDAACMVRKAELMKEGGNG